MLVPMYLYIQGCPLNDKVMFGEGEAGRRMGRGKW